MTSQGSIQQLVIRDDPRAAEDQCEDDDPYVRNTRTHIITLMYQTCLFCWSFWAAKVTSLTWWTAASGGQSPHNTTASVPTAVTLECVCVCVCWMKASGDTSGDSSLDESETEEEVMKRSEASSSAPVGFCQLPPKRSIRPQTCHNEPWLPG